MSAFTHTTLQNRLYNEKKKHNLVTDSLFFRRFINAHPPPISIEPSGWRGWHWLHHPSAVDRKTNCNRRLLPPLLHPHPDQIGGINFYLSNIRKHCSTCCYNDGALLLFLMCSEYKIYPFLRLHKKIENKKWEFICDWAWNSNFRLIIVKLDLDDADERFFLFHPLFMKKGYKKILDDEDSLSSFLICYILCQKQKQAIETKIYIHIFG